MDKRGTGILLSCILCTMLIVALFIVTIRFTQHSCELIIVEPAQFRYSAQLNFAKVKPTRSHDKSMLLKISAHLEYFSSPSESSSPASSVVNTQDHQAQVFGQQQASTTQHANSASIQQQTSSNHNKHPNPSNPQTNFDSNNHLNSNRNISGYGTTFSASFGNNEATTKEGRRILPLELDSIDMKKIDNTRYQYTLKFNCSTMDVVFNRTPDRVFVSSLSVDLKQPSNGKNKCELQLPNQNIFEVKVHDGLAHYYCGRALRYSCYHHSSKTPGKPAELLADLQINSIEFETGSNSSHPNHKSNEFQSVKSKHPSYL